MKFIARAAFFVALLLTFSSTSLAVTYFRANMTGAQETPPSGSNATGFGRVALNDAETQITASFYYGTPVALGSNVTAGHIHTGAFGSAGPITFNMTPTTGVTSGSVVGATFAVTAQQVADLKAGNMYFNVHTVNFAGGEIRGQLVLDAPYVANMTNGQENPASSQAGARGFGAVTVNEATNQAIVTMSWSGLSGNTTASHYHSGRAGTNGPIICNFNLSGQPTSGTLTDFLCTFSAAQITSLKQGQLYLNIHTSANPGGEIRGQIQRRRSTVVDFDGDSKTDYAIARNNTTAGTIDWWTLNSSNGGVSVFPFGATAEFSTSRIGAADFDGDGKDDPWIWRSAATPGAGFLILESANSTVRFVQFGTTSDDPRVVYDYDGDGRADPAVYRPTGSTFFFQGSSNNAAGAITYVPWVTSSFANPGDYDGDGKGDFMVQSGGNWQILRSSDLGFTSVQLGSGSMFGTPGDYDGDGKTDVAGTLTESSGTAWYYIATSNPNQNVFLTRGFFGTTSRTRVQGDYDGDGRTDYALWTTTAPQAFWVTPANGSATYAVPWGTTGDFAVAGYNNR